VQDGVVGPQPYWTPMREERCEKRLARLEGAIDQVEQERGQHHPRELIPVKEGETEERGRGTRIELWKAKPDVGRSQQYPHPRWRALLRGGRLGAGVHAEIVSLRVWTMQS